ncbi:Homeobox-leucine zipper protein [Klebsormidium nitens]|uniref:Homeobox-leucine zipper protein n=1 Tax=Klebsormidium nitens TaxID=105231 RepID=A0A0U9HVT9_KLENI|nr:Homeobox-leucine zipper protein [Klebsormidium nitens]|eukprot:GAQ92060.1 Homeobox-leucine zipper protein [Klebsormidium nitens]
MRNCDGPHTGVPQGKFGALTAGVPGRSPRDVIVAAEDERELHFIPGADRHAGSGRTTVHLEAEAAEGERPQSPGPKVPSSGSVPSPPKRESQHDSAQKTSSGSGDNSTKGESARKKLSHRQVEVLEEVFQMDPAGVPEHRAALAREFGVAQQQIATWFQNRRARERNRQLHRDFEALRECLMETSNDNLRLRMEVEELRATHAQCKSGAGLAAKHEPATFPAPARHSQPGRTPGRDANEWTGRVYCPPDVKHKSMRAVSLLDPSGSYGSAPPSFRSPLPVPSASTDSHVAAHFHPGSLPLTFGLPPRNDPSPSPASPPALFPSLLEPKGDVTLDEALSGVLRHGPGLGSAGGLVPSRGVGVRALPAPGIAVPATSAGVPGQPLGGGLARWAGQAQEASPPWDGTEDLWQGMERVLPAWYFRNQRG